MKIKNVVKSAKKVGDWAGDAATLGASHYVSSQNANARKKEHADELALQENEAQMKALGIDAMGNYKRSEAKLADVDKIQLTEGQKAALDKQEQIDKMRAKQFLASAGLSDSTSSLGMESNIERDRLITEDAMLRDEKRYQEGLIRQDMDRYWSESMQAMGYSQQEQNALMQMHQQDRQEQMDAYTAVIGATGSIVGGMASGKPATPAAK